MRKKELPSFSALIAFEAAARHQSFKRAADELCISQAAISRQIRLLEKNLGGELFERRHRAVSLNEDGQYFLDAVSQGLNRIGTAANTLRKRHEHNGITIGLVSSLSVFFLAPRIGEFRKQYPDIDTYMISMDTNPDPVKDSFDIMVRMDRSCHADYEATLLFSEEVFPVCSPAYLEKNGPVSSIDDLFQHALLNADDDRWRGFPWQPINWESWFREFGREFKSYDGPQYSNYQMMFNTVLSGYGICLGWRHLVGDLLKNGDLVRPINESIKPDREHYILIRKSLLERKSVRAFKDWFLNEINQMNSRI